MDTKAHEAMTAATAFAEDGPYAVDGESDSAERKLRDDSGRTCHCRWERCCNHIEHMRAHVSLQRRALRCMNA